METVKQIYKRLLNEALLNVDRSDIEKLFRPLSLLSKDVELALKIKDEDVQDKAFFVIWEKHKKLIDYWKQFESSELSSPLCKAANEINPIEIVVGVVGASLYSPVKQVIMIGPTKEEYAHLMNFRYLKDGNKRKRITDMFGADRLKGVIRHELTHWIDDTLHNFNLTKVAKINDVDAFTRYLKRGKAHIYLGGSEINAMVHQLATHKDSVGDERWQSMTWGDVLDTFPYMRKFNTMLGDKFRKEMKRRMHREKLLGPNMR